MKKNLPCLLLSLLFMVLMLGACERSQSTPPPETVSPTPEIVTQLPDAIASQTAAPTLADLTPTPAPPTPTELAPEPTEEPEPEVEPPTATVTSEPPEEVTLVPKDQPTDTPTPTATVPGVAFDPYDTYGDPAFSDPMNSGSFGNWKSGGKLPNTEYIQLSLNNDQMYVTGKQVNFSTWYFSWPTLKNFYLQLTVESGACAGKDAYGLILRGPAHGAGVSYGYIVAFTCDGRYRVSRLDSADPFSETELLPYTQSDYIQAGANQQNMIGAKAVDDKLTIYANGYQIAEISDATYAKGRYGFFVQAVETVNYTYRPMELAYWILPE